MVTEGKIVAKTAGTATMAESIPSMSVGARSAPMLYIALTALGVPASPQTITVQGLAPALTRASLIEMTFAVSALYPTIHVLVLAICVRSILGRSSLNVDVPRRS